MDPSSRIDLPAQVLGPFEVFVNGVLQRPGVDYDQVGRRLVFRRQLVQEGRLGFWRWTSMFLGVAGTYRRNDAVDIVYEEAGRRTVLSVRPEPSE